MERQKFVSSLWFTVLWIGLTCATGWAEATAPPSHYIIVLARGLPSHVRAGIKESLADAITTLPAGTRVSVFVGGDLSNLADFQLQEAGRARMRDRTLAQGLRAVVAFLDSAVEGDRQLGIPGLPGAFWQVHTEAIPTATTRIVLVGDPVFHSQRPDVVAWSMRGQRIPSDRVALAQDPSAYVDQIHQRIPPGTEIVLVPPQPVFGESSRHRQLIIRFWRLLAEKHLGGHLIRVTPSLSLALTPYIENQFSQPVVPSSSTYFGMVQLTTGTTQEFGDEPIAPRPAESPSRVAVMPPAARGIDSPAVPAATTPSPASSTTSTPAVTSLPASGTPTASPSTPPTPIPQASLPCPDLPEPRTVLLPQATTEVAEATADAKAGTSSSDNTTPATPDLENSPEIPPAPASDQPEESVSVVADPAIEITVSWTCECPHARLRLKLLRDATDPAVLASADGDNIERIPDPLTVKLNNAVDADSVLELVAQDVHREIQGTITIRKAATVHTKKFQLNSDRLRWSQLISDLVNTPIPSPQP